jgi:spermidine/putrescine transport system ATP-binding protein
VGSANILQGKVVSREVTSGGGETLEMEHPSGRVAAASGGGGLAIGQTVTAAVRSEHILLGPAGGPGDGGLAGTITDKSFAGGQLRIAVKLQSGEEIISSRHGIDSPLHTGEAVRVHWNSPAHAVVVDSEDRDA